MSSIAEADRDQPISVTGLRLHVLASGARFDLDTRKPLQD